MRLEISVVQDIAQRLEGTALTLEEIFLEMGLNYLEVDEMSILDIEDYVFECSQCGYWYELGELSDVENDKVCQGCDEN